jgi:hypothetical protein
VSVEGDVDDRVEFDGVVGHAALAMLEVEVADAGQGDGD